eukprot:6179962-Pleurochrysis_carterae.AAC.2
MDAATLQNEKPQWDLESSQTSEAKSASITAFPDCLLDGSNASISEVKLGVPSGMDQGSRVKAIDLNQSHASTASSSGGRRDWAETIVACRDVKLKGEDRFTTKREVINGQRVVFCMVADGHNSSDAAEYCKKHILSFIVEACLGHASAHAIQDACVIAFHKVHEHIRTKSAWPTSGLTLAVVAVNEDERFVVCANVGDVESLIVLGKDRKKRSRYSVLTTNHRFDKNKDEVKRVEAVTETRVRPALNFAGKPQGPPRGWPGGLLFGRALGDADCEDAISPDPSLSVMRLDALSGNATIVIGSDGLWNAVEMTRVACHVHQAQKTRQDATRTAQMLVDKACNGDDAYHNSEWGKAKDDTTCAVMIVGPDYYLST